MRKLSKNFYGQRQTVEAMSGGCAGGNCVCYTFDCYCNTPNPDDVKLKNSGQSSQNTTEKNTYTYRVVNG